MTSETQLPVTPGGPWVGLRGYGEVDRMRFFGRTQELDRLEHLVQQFSLTVLHGLSGIGKSSLVRAGLFPRLRSMGWLPVLVRVDWGGGSKSMIDQVIERCEAEHVINVSADHVIQGKTLWELFRDPTQGLVEQANGPPLRWLLYFDQFEECLQDVDARMEERRRLFLNELVALIQDYPPPSAIGRINADPVLATRLRYGHSWPRVLVSVRQDYVHAITEKPMSDCRTTMGMMGLKQITGLQALEVVAAPARSAGIHIQNDVAEAIVRQVAQVPNEVALEDFTVVPSILNLTCQQLDERRREVGSDAITLEQVHASENSALTSYYNSVFSSQPAAVERFVEEYLITIAGYRNIVSLEHATDGLLKLGISDPRASIDHLISQRFLTIHEQRGVRWVELVHDVLVPLVKQRRDQRGERERLNKEIENRERVVRAQAYTRLWWSALVALLVLLVLSLVIFLLFR